MCPYLSSEGGVWVVEGAWYLVLLCSVLDLSDQGGDGLVLFVGLPEGGLELVVGIDEPLDLLNGVDDEHVHQVLTGTVQPVVKRLCGIMIYKLISKRQGIYCTKVT